MFRRLTPLALLLAGCTAGRTTLAPAPPTPVRATLADTGRTLVEARLAGDGWQGEVLDVARAGLSASNPDEEWDETVVRVTFAVKGTDGAPRLLTQPEVAMLLCGLRADVRRTVMAFGGEIKDSADGEAFRERWVVQPYKVGGTVGWAKATVSPASHKAEETVSRLELVIRESPSR